MNQSTIDKGKQYVLILCNISCASAQNWNREEIKFVFMVSITLHSDFILFISKNIKVNNVLYSKKLYIHIGFKLRQNVQHKN